MIAQAVNIFKNVYTIFHTHKDFVNSLMHART